MSCCHDDNITLTKKGETPDITALPDGTPLRGKDDIGPYRLGMAKVPEAVVAILGDDISGTDYAFRLSGAVPAPEPPKERLTEDNELVVGPEDVIKAAYRGSLVAIGDVWYQVRRSDLGVQLKGEGHVPVPTGGDMAGATAALTAKQLDARGSALLYSEQGDYADPGDFADLDDEDYDEGARFGEARWGGQVRGEDGVATPDRRFLGTLTEILAKVAEDERRPAARLLGKLMTEAPDLFRITAEDINWAYAIVRTAVLEQTDVHERRVHRLSMDLVTELLYGLADRKNGGSNIVAELSGPDAAAIIEAMGLQRDAEAEEPPGAADITTLPDGPPEAGEAAARAVLRDLAANPPAENPGTTWALPDVSCRVVDSVTDGGPVVVEAPDSGELVESSCCHFQGQAPEQE